MLKRFAVYSGVAMLALASGAAHAADLDQVIYAPEVPMTKPVEVGSGWYLRGDLGYSLSTKGAATSYSSYTNVPAPAYFNTLYGSSSLEGDWSGSLGAGYSFTDYLRADATLDFTEADFAASTAFAIPCFGSPVGTTCRGDDAQSVTTYGFMANVYADLGTLAGFTPYLGGGAGFSKVSWDDLSTTATCLGVGCGAPVTSVNPGLESWRFTYALMAGLSYDVSQNVKIDLGYRYQNIADGEMYGYDAASVAAGAAGVRAHDNGFEKHEVRAGLRYALW